MAADKAGPALDAMRWPSARIAAVCGLRDAGVPLARIALLAGVSRARIAAVLAAADQAVKAANCEIDEE